MKGDGIFKVEVILTMQANGKKYRSKFSGRPLKDHFQFSQTRSHKVVSKKGKDVFVPAKEVSVMLYMKYKTEKS